MNQPLEIGSLMQEVRAKPKRLNIFLYQSSLTPVFGVRSRQLPLSTTAFLTEECLPPMGSRTPGIPSLPASNEEEPL